MNNIIKLSRTTKLNIDYSKLIFVGLFEEREIKDFPYSVIDDYLRGYLKALLENNTKLYYFKNNNNFYAFWREECNEKELEDIYL